LPGLVCPKLTQAPGGRPPCQDGYTLERVDIYGPIGDGLHETVVMPGVECYVGRNDNPSFSSCGRPFSIHSTAFHIKFSWFGAARRTFGRYLACRRSVGPEQGIVLY
jgi:hypothetical protein